MSQQETPRIELPPPEADQPAWGRVGIIALLGFVVGVVWPRLAGVSLGPNPPADAPRAAAASSSAAPAKTGLSAVAPLETPTPAVSGAPSDGSNEQGVTVSAAEITRCRDLKGKTAETCDKIDVEAVFPPRLRELSKCPSALGLAGKVEVGFDLDFKSKTVKVLRPKAKLPRTTLDGLTRCVEKSLGGVSLDEINHENGRYTLSYEVSFHPPGQAPEGAGSDADKGTPLDGKPARITWGSCQVRETPKNGQVIGKLSRHAEVKLLEQKEGWYRVEYGDKKQGWIFGGALGL